MGTIIHLPQWCSLPCLSLFICAVQIIALICVVRKIHSLICSKYPLTKCMYSVYLKLIHKYEIWVKWLINNTLAWPSYLTLSPSAEEDPTLKKCVLSHSMNNFYCYYLLSGQNPFLWDFKAIQFVAPSLRNNIKL